MNELPNIERANENNWLWPSIADAVDTFLRRRETAEAYERIWRLIHIWESVTTVLSGAATARLRHCGGNVSASFLKVREHLYGTNYDKIDHRMKSCQGAFDGSNDKRIEILRVVEKTETPPSNFLARLKTFLQWSEATCVVSDGDNTTKPGTMSRTVQELVSVWKNVCDVPTHMGQGAPTVMQTIALVNIFRNRFAHVPFPYDPVEPLVDALESLTESLFSVEPWPFTHEGVLTGGLVQGETLWRGGLHTRWRGKSREDTFFVFPAHKPTEEWPAGPFIYLDLNKRPYVLTRLKDRDTGTWEYTRYRAEANSVISNDAEGLLGWISAPHESEYQQPEDVETEAEAVAAVTTTTLPMDMTTTATTTTPEPTTQIPEGSTERIVEAPQSRILSSFGEALDAVRQGDYDSAIPFLDRLVEQRPNYHIGWLRLGYAQREKAARCATDCQEESLKLLDASIESFSNALGHIDPDYQADAFYQRSKAYYRRYAIGRQKEDAEKAMTDGNKACDLSSDSRFQTWIDYLHRIVKQSLIVSP